MSNPIAYSPAKRTALVFTGTGTGGAYHAGVLRALQEAGVKVDLVAGHGVGAATAVLAAIDGGARLWDADGLWRTASLRRFYGWTWSLRLAGWLMVVLLAVLLVPLAVLAIATVIYAVGFLLEMAGSGAGGALVAWCSGLLQRLFSGASLPTVVPRAALLVIAVALVILLGGILVAQWRAPRRRRERGGWWWRILGAPLDAIPMRDAVRQLAWQLVRGAAAEDVPSGAAFGRRYGDVLGENLGQPGFRELVLVVSDVDARRDLVAALLREPYRQEFFAAQRHRDRESDTVDLTGAGHALTLDLICGALTPPLGSDLHPVTFPPDNFWRGETHRLADRPGALVRLLEEVAEAGATQAIIVSAVAPAAPHRLSAPPLDIQGRIGESIAAAEAAALRDAVEHARLRFDAIYAIGPVHNPVGPFDFSGIYDEASDRRLPLDELIDRGYGDAYHQFIEPVIGASGEQLVRRGSSGHFHEHGLVDDPDPLRGR